MKKFECNPKCEKVFIESITFGCQNCIKKTVVDLTPKQSKEVELVLKKYFN